MRCLLVAIAAVGLATAADVRAQSSRDIERLLLGVCSTETDTFQELKRLFESVQATGEPGKTVLLKIANSRRPERACALRYLIRLEDRRAVAVVHRALRDAHSEPSFREAALEGVATFRDAAMIGEALEAFTSTSVLLRLGAASALGAIDDPRTLQVLRDAALDPSYENVRVPIVRALGTSGREPAIDTLLDLSRDPSYMRSALLRLEVGASLARIGTTRSRQEAVALVTRTSDVEVRAQLKTQIIEIFLAQEQAAHDAVTKDSIEQLVANLKH